MIAFSEEDVLRSIVRDSFYDFVKEFWDTIVPESPVWNWHIKYICKELQKVTERVFLGLPKEYDLIINMPPGMTKSTLCSEMLPAWCWTRMDTMRIIGGSYAKDLSMDLARRNRDIVKSDKYQTLFPHIKLRADQDVKSYFANTAGGSRYATGTGGAVTGFHAHIIVVDDPLNPNEAVSEVELESANQWMDETLSQRKVDKAVTPTILVMQRLHQNDPTNNMIERAKLARDEMRRRGDAEAKIKIRHICLPAEVTDKIKPKKLRSKYVEGLLDPVRLPRTVLTDNMALGDYIYGSQFLQWPVPRGGGLFKTERIKIDEPHRKWKRKVRFWDKAATESAKAKYSVGLLMGQDVNNHFWVLDVIRGRWSSDRREELIKQTAQIDGEDVEVGVEQEPGSGGKESAENTVKNLYGFRVFIDKPSGGQQSKELRAEPYSVQVNMGNVSMVKGHWNRAYIEELMFFPMSTYKDQVDASSGAFNRISGKNILVGAIR